MNEDALRDLVESNPRQTTRGIAAAFGCSHATIETHLAAIGKVPKLGTWVPHLLTDCDRKRRTEVCLSLLSFSRTTAWLETILTGDEKWVLYVNVKRKHQWIDKEKTAEREVKRDLHPQKIMLCVWWDCKGVVWFELLPPNTTITANLYCQQLQRLSEKLSEMRPRHGKIRFLHDNARPHVAKITRQKLLDLNFEVLPHPPYSPDLAPSDYHLFRKLEADISHKKFGNEDEVHQFLTDFFAMQTEEFYRCGIYSLTTRWQQVIDQDGEYILD